MKGKGFIVIFLSIIIVLLFASPCLGNAAEPPSILIIVNNPPEDLEINLLAAPSAEARITSKAYESYYAFYYRDLKGTQDYTIKVTTSGKSFEVPLEKPPQAYNNIFTLDLNKKTLEPGKSLERSALLVSMRVLLTLLIEGIIFWVFGYREQKSWYAFFVLNLLTQGALNIWLNNLSPLASYMILNLIVGEIQVFVAELVVFMAFLQEHGRWRTLAYVMTANLISLFAGGYIITYLPV